MSKAQAGRPGSIDKRGVFHRQISGATTGGVDLGEPDLKRYIHYY